MTTSVVLFDLGGTLACYTARHEFTGILRAAVVGARSALANGEALAEPMAGDRIPTLRDPPPLLCHEPPNTLDTHHLQVGDPERYAVQ